MIYYFSGTGNSAWVARYLGEAFNEPVCAIAEATKTNATFSHTLQTTEKLFFVFPVHSWGPAVSMARFIEQLELINYTNQPIYAVCVCGDDCGNTDRIIRGLLAKKGYSLSDCFSVTMPNNYILLPGFDVDSATVANEKLQAAPPALGQIIATIQAQTHELHYVRGSLPGLKSSCIYPLFVKFALRSSPFRATTACIGCGKCERMCPVSAIHMKEKRPVWNNNCVQCLACIHRCPVRAIEYGNATLKKGRYHHPDCKV